GSADLVEAMHPVPSRPAIAIFRQIGKLDTVIGQHRMQPVRYGREQCFEEAHGGRTISLVVQFDEGEFRGSVNRDKQVELELGCFGPVGRSATKLRLRHLATVFGLMPWRLASALRLS